MRALTKSFWMLAAVLAASGCAGGPRPVQTDTQLGKVIIYRNGVAYFERYAAPGERSIALRVPAERVDDFLKSLSIVDEESGKALPVSYPTIETYDGYVEMRITLPPRRGRLRITYVTESPAWKPSYRVVLGKDDGAARLHGWAVVDNASGEDWKKVRVGVGSTSALSFRYDLHSVRLVERETLSDGTRLAAAPPMGGSPYAVAKRKVRVMGSLSDADVRALGTETTMQEHRFEPQDVAIVGKSTALEHKGRSTGAAANAPAKDPEPKNLRDQRYFRDLSKRLQGGQHQVTIEGYAQSGDADPHAASVARANAVKEKLVALGVPAGNIQAVGTGELNSQQAVRIVEAEDLEGAGGGEHQSERAPEDTQPVGRAHFVSKHALTIEADHSAMVSILNAPTEAKRVYFYDPVSSRGSRTHAFNAVRIKNPSRYTLDGGPFTIYAGGQFLGEGLSEPILPGQVAFIPYALDRSIVVEPDESTREELDRLVTIQRGIVTAESRRVRRTVLSLANRGKRSAEVYLRHKVAPGYELSESSKRQLVKIEKLGGAHLFRVEVPAGEAIELAIEEHTPLMKTVDIRTQPGIDAIAVFLKKQRINPELGDKLDDIVRAHTKKSDLEERIAVLDEQTAVYRTRIDELNFQLATLRKVQQAAKLRQNLADKMEEISNRLQEATMEMTDLKGQLMTLRIEVQDRIAELTLQKKKEAREELAATRPGS